MTGAACCPDCHRFVSRTPVGVERDVDYDDDGRPCDDTFGVFECRFCDDVFAARVDDDGLLAVPVEQVPLSWFLRQIYTVGIEIRIGGSAA